MKSPAHLKTHWMRVGKNHCKPNRGQFCQMVMPVRAGSLCPARNRHGPQRQSTGCYNRDGGLRDRGGRVGVTNRLSRPAFHGGYLGRAGPPAAGHAGGRSQPNRLIQQARCRPAPGRHWNARSRNFSDQSIGEDECHVVYLLHRKICDTPLHLGDVHAPSRDDACVRHSNRGGEENQRQAEHDQDS